MRRISVIGVGGSGKTELANRLAALLEVPVTHLDAVYYADDWTPLAPEEFAARQRELVAAPAWVIDGNYASTLDIRLKACDTVIFLDIPPAVALFGVLRRRLRYRGGQHPGQGVYDRITWGVVQYILGYRRRMRPKVEHLIAEHGTHATVHVFTSRRAVNRWLASLEPAAG
ncbi:topology modulation protein [Streptodolium elevatio]|uniref:Topology modulation protein n=1 Tax=Streptodolium elevatio TaxID=3157996 RepID=A0ABV3D8U7_9ACTN